MRSECQERAAQQQITCKRLRLSRTDMSRTGGIRSCAFVMHRAACWPSACFVPLYLCAPPPPPRRGGVGGTRHKPKQHINAQLSFFSLSDSPADPAAFSPSLAPPAAPSALPVNTAESPYTKGKPRDVSTQLADPGTRCSDAAWNTRYIALPTPTNRKRSGSTGMIHQMETSPSNPTDLVHSTQLLHLQAHRRRVRWR